MRSLLTMLGIIIGIAAVMIIVSVITGANKKSMEYYESMGTNKISVSAQLYSGGDAFEEVYNYCKSIDMVVGVTPTGYVGGTVKYGAKTARAWSIRRRSIWAAISTPCATISRLTRGGI